MALVIINRSAPESAQLIQLKRALWDAQNIAQQIQRQNGNSSDADIEAVYGVPQASATVFKTTVDDVVIALEVAAVENYLGNLA